MHRHRLWHRPLPDESNIELWEQINKALHHVRTILPSRSAMQQLPKVDNSDRDLLYTLSSSFNIPPASGSTGMAQMFSGPASLPLSRSIPSDWPFIQRAHPSLYKPNHETGPLQRSEKSTQRLSITPPTGSPHRAHRLPTISNSRRRSHSDGEEETLDGPLPEDATEQEKIDWRRRQNTLAARKSRKRKMEQMQQLQEDVQRLSKEKDVWRERALMMKQLLISHGLPSPNFER